MDARPLVAALVLLVAVAGPAAATTAGSAGVASTGGSAAASQAECAFPVTMTDATGTDVTVSEAPARVTVLGPSAAQTLWELGARDRVVGAPHQFSSYLDGVEETTDVSGPGQSYVANELVVNTSPDLVLAPNIIADDTVSKLRDAGLTVYKFREATTIADVYAKTNRTGRLLGDCEAAAETVAWMQHRIGAIRDAVADEPTPSVLISMGGGFTAGSGTFLHEVVTVAGVSNVAADAGITGYGELSGETVVQQDPDWIVQNGQFGTYPNSAAYNGTTAVRSGQVFTVDASHVSQPAPRIVYAIENVTKRVHPEAYDAAMASLEAETTATTEEPTETTRASTEAETTEAAATETTAAGTTASETTATEATETGGQPGFGVAVALVALVGALLAASRRD